MRDKVYIIHLKQQVYGEMKREIDKHHLTRKDVAILLDSFYTRTCDLIAGKLHLFSLEKLLIYAMRLGIRLVIMAEKPKVTKDTSRLKELQERIM